MNIVLYSKSNCPNCSTAKALLKSKGLEYTEIDCDNPYEFDGLREKYPEVKQLPQTHIRGVPQVRQVHCVRKQNRTDRDGEQMKTVIEMARESADPDKVDPFRNGFWVLTQEELERFAELVRAEENEACAKIADEAEPYNAADLIRKRMKT